MFWLVIAAALVVALIFGASFAIVAMASLAVGALFLLLLVFDVVALIWVSLGVLAVFTMIETGQRTTLWFIGFGLLASFVILLERNRSNLEPVQADPQMRAPRPRRRAPQGLPTEFVAAPADARVSQRAPFQQLAPVSAETGAEVSASPPRAAVQQTLDNWPFEDSPSYSGIGLLARTAFAFLRFPRRRIVGRI